VPPLLSFPPANQSTAWPKTTPSASAASSHLPLEADQKDTNVDEFFASQAFLNAKQDDEINSRNVSAYDDEDQYYVDASEAFDLGLSLTDVDGTNVRSHHCRTRFIRLLLQHLWQKRQ